jgi:hypothetical protein
MKGRKPKPIDQQIAEGDPRRHGINKLKERLAAEPKATRGLPQCPRHLRGRSRAAWSFWSAELEAMNIDRRPDAHYVGSPRLESSRIIANFAVFEIDC